MQVSWVFCSISGFLDVVNLYSPNAELGGFVVEGGFPNIEPPVPPPTNIIRSQFNPNPGLSPIERYSFKIRERQGYEKTKTAGN